MTKFLDGPAAGQVLSLRRTPLLLRVVRSARGKWDALDLIADQPKPGEALFLYRLAERKGSGFGCVRGGKGSGCFQLADYRFVADQPADEIMRDNLAWREWCLALQAAEGKVNP